MAKKCPPGKYYCFTDKKCKKIPCGYRIGARGYLARDTKDDDSETKKNGNGSSNGNGNGGNGAGNGNGGSGGNGGGNGGGGMGESIVYEASNPRIPRKKGQPAKSKKHSDLYTDEDPKGTIHGLGFKDVAKAKASVSKIRNSSRSHAHKIQAAVAMEQRAREMGKTSEAAVYRKFINTMKKKTKKMNEDVKRDEYGDPVGGPKISKKQKEKNLKSNTPDEQHTTTTSEAANPAQQAAIAINMKKRGKKPKDMSEEGLRDWFGKSSGTTKSGRRVRGWVQVGGKYDGKPCARQPGQKTTPKCVSSSKRRSMSKDERDSARRRKVAADPGQPQKTGAAKPTMVSTDPKKKMKENVSFAEAKDKKGKGSGTKDACYHKVKSRYSVWPSAYASGALVKCRKVGAKNWGNKTKKEEYEYSDWREEYTKGMRKKGQIKVVNTGETLKKSVENQIMTDPNLQLIKKRFKKEEFSPEVPSIEEKFTKIQETGKTYHVRLNWKGRYLGIQIFFPQFNRPSKMQVTSEVEKLYPGAMVISYQPHFRDPTKAFLYAGTENESR